MCYIYIQDVGCWSVVSKPKITEGPSMDTVFAFFLPQLVGTNYKKKKTGKKKTGKDIPKNNPNNTVYIFRYRGPAVRAEV